MMRRRSGFTLIELLVVVVIVGILAAVAIPKFSATREQATLAAMKGALRNLLPATEAWYNDHHSYVGFVPDSAANGIVIRYTGAISGWSATATSSNTDRQCLIAFGSAVVGAAGHGVARCP